MLDKLSLNQKRVGIILISILVIGVYIFFHNKNNIQEKEVLEENILVKEEEKSSKDEKEIIVIHITGAVKKPGIVKLPEGSRIEDAISLAGGLTEDADLSNVNLAYVLEDGTKVKIPSIQSEEEPNENIIINDNLENEIENTSKELEVNINTAKKEELQSLPGIGATLATRIVQYRNDFGKFSSIEEIKNVSGVGESKFENIKKYITVK